MKTKIILGIDWFYQKFQAWTQLCGFLLGRGGVGGFKCSNAGQTHPAPEAWFCPKMSYFWAILSLKVPKI